MSQLSADQEWTQVRRRLKRAGTYGMNLATTVEGMGADAFERAHFDFPQQQSEYKVSVVYAKKGASSPPESQAAIRQEISLDLDKVLSK